MVSFVEICYAYLFSIMCVFTLLFSHVNGALVRMDQQLQACYVILKKTIVIL